MKANDISRSNSDPALKEPLIAKPRLISNSDNPVVPPKRRRSTTQQLLAEAANSCTPITKYITDPKRKRVNNEDSSPEELDQPLKITRKVDSSELIKNPDADNSYNTVMDKILPELKGLRIDQENKHKELTDKLNKKLQDDLAAFLSIQNKLSKLNTELIGTKNDLSMRIEVLERNTVKKDELNNLITTSSPRVENDKVIQLSNRIDYLEKENKKTKISIVGLSLSSNDHSEEVKLFLDSKFEINIPRIMLTEFSNRLIVDLFDAYLKNFILKNNKSKLNGTSIFIESDKTSK